MIVEKVSNSAFCNEYSFKRLWFTNVSALRRIQSKVFLYSRFCAWSRMFHWYRYYCCMRALFICPVSNLSVRVAFRALCLSCESMCFSDQFMNLTTSLRNLCQFYLPYSTLNLQMSWLSEYVYGICARNFHDFLSPYS